MSGMQSTGNAPHVVGNWQGNWQGKGAEMIALYPNSTFEKFFTAQPGNVVSGTYTFSNGTLVLTSVRLGTEQIQLMPVSDTEMNATYNQGPTFPHGATARWFRRF